MVVKDNVLLTLSLKLHNRAQLLCHFCPLFSRPSRIGQTVEQLTMLNLLKSTKLSL